MFVTPFPCSVLTVLVRQQEGHLAHKPAATAVVLRGSLLWTRPKLEKLQKRMMAKQKCLSVNT